MRFSFSVGALAFLFSLAGYAQAPAQNLGSDRPGATFSANTVGQYVLQVQAGADVFQTQTNNVVYLLPSGGSLQTDNLERLYATNTDLRFGLLDNFELMASLSTARSYFENDLDTFYADPAYTPSFLVRANVVNQNQFQLGLMGGLQLAQNDFVFYVARAMANWNWTEKSSLAANLSYTSSNFDSRQIGYTLNYSYSFGRLGLFIENYGNFIYQPINETWEPFLFFNAGAAYLLTPDFQLDVTYNFGLNSAGVAAPNPNLQVLQNGLSLGFSWRFFAP
jgi:hypothetical protein